MLPPTAHCWEKQENGEFVVQLDYDEEMGPLLGM